MNKSEDLKKAFNSLDIYKKKMNEVTNKLEVLMQKYNDCILQGKKPSLELTTQLNRQVDLLMNGNRDIKKILDSMSNIF